MPTFIFSYGRSSTLNPNEQVTQSQFRTSVASRLSSLFSPQYINDVLHHAQKTLSKRKYFAILSLLGIGNIDHWCSSSVSIDVMQCSPSPHQCVVHLKYVCIIRLFELCICLNLQNVFVKITKCICLKLQNIYVSNCKIDVMQCRLHISVSSI